jgi:hypothetical protein
VNQWIDKTTEDDVGKDGVVLSFLLMGGIIEKDRWHH